MNTEGKIKIEFEYTKDVYSNEDLINTYIREFKIDTLCYSDDGLYLTNREFDNINTTNTININNTIYIIRNIYLKIIEDEKIFVCTIKNSKHIDNDLPF